MKSQVVVDFIVELTPSMFSDSKCDLEWTMYVEGSSNDKGCRVGVLLLAPDDMHFEYVLRFNFRTFNNEVEYEALLARLQMAKRLGAHRTQMYNDSQLIMNQIKEEYQAKDS